MKKLIGIVGLLLFLWIFLATNTADPWYNVLNSNFLKPNNIENLLSRTAMYGLLGIGVSLVIIHSGIDLSIGSVVCLTGVLLAIFLRVDYLPFESIPVAEVVERTSEPTASDNDSDSPSSRAGSDRGASHSRQKIKIANSDGELVEGMFVRYEAGRDGQNLLLEVSAVETEGNQRVLTVDRSLGVPETMAQIVPTVAVVDFARERTDKNVDLPATLTIKGEFNELRPRDKINMYDPSGGFGNQQIAAVDVKNGNTVLTLTNDLRASFSTDWKIVLMERRPLMPIPIAVLAVLVIGISLGAVHGLLVTGLKLQPFVVTLCGLLIYRGVAQWLGGNKGVGFGQEYSDTLSPIAIGKLQLTSSFGIPYALFIFLIVAVAAAVFLNQTTWGRYLLALGKNEDAARYSGINTSRIIILAYMICAGLAAVGGMLFALNANTVSPSSFGNFFELYAIAAAVLGGCSLRGGEGSIAGVILGTMLMQTLYNMITLMGFSDDLQNAIIGMVILIGVIADEAFKRMSARRRAAAQAKAIEGKAASE